MIIDHRCREIQPQMRYCEFNCADDASCDAAMSEMINMRLQLTEEEGVLQEDFDVSLKFIFFKILPYSKATKINFA